MSETEIATDVFPTIYVKVKDSWYFLFPKDEKKGSNEEKEEKEGNVNAKMGMDETILISKEMGGVPGQEDDLKTKKNQLISDNLKETEEEEDEKIKLLIESSTSQKNYIFEDFSMFESTIEKLSFLIRTTMGIDSDISLEFPQLELTFHPHQHYAKSVYLSLLHSFYLSLLKYDKKIPNPITPMRIEVIIHNYTFIKRYNLLLNLFKKGGRAEDPIVLEEDEEDKEDNQNELEEEIDQNDAPENAIDDIFPEDYEGGRDVVIIHSLELEEDEELKDHKRLKSES